MAGKMTFSRVFDTLLRSFGGLLAVLLGALFAILEAVATPRLWLIPVLAAITGNIFLYWFAQTTVGKSWAWTLAAAPWGLVMIASIGPTREGDQLANSYPGLVTFAAGAITFFALAALRPRPPRRRPPITNNPPDPAPSPTSAPSPTAPALSATTTSPATVPPAPSATAPSATPAPPLPSPPARP
jgi:hypothetical protein